MKIPSRLETAQRLGLLNGYALVGVVAGDLGHIVCRELLQTVHERRPGEFSGMNDLGHSAGTFAEF